MVPMGRCRKWPHSRGLEGGSQGCCTLMILLRSDCPDRRSLHRGMRMRLCEYQYLQATLSVAIDPRPLAGSEDGDRVVVLGQSQDISSSPSSSLSPLSTPSRSWKVMNADLASFSVMLSHLDLTSRSTSSSKIREGNTSGHREASPSDLPVLDGG